MDGKIKWSETMEEFQCNECNRKFNSEESLNQHRNAKHEHDKKKNANKLKINKKHYFLIGTLLIILVLGFLTYNSITSPGKYDDFAKCLTEKGFTMAGTNWCSSCKNQKGLFGKSFQYVTYQDCDNNEAWCDSKGIERYPTWVLPDNTKITGVLKPYDLSRISGCSLE